MSVPSASIDLTALRIPEVLAAVLRCPTCAGTLREIGASVRCDACGAAHAVVAGVPRFVPDQLNATAARTRESFGYEWTHFADWTASGQTNFSDYFGDLRLEALAEARVLDAGCGMGRHARMMAPHVHQLVALDFSAAIEQAARTLAGFPHVACVQADVSNPPLADASFDFVYSLGVLHHLDDTAGALGRLARLVRPGGRLRVYLYWQPEGWRGRLLAAVNGLRPITTRLPFPVLKGFCLGLSVALWLAVVLPYRALLAAGVDAILRLPLVQYAKYPFVILYNDQFDRFSAPLEKRYREHEVKALMESCGLEDIRIWPRFGWMAEGRRPLGLA